MSENRKRIEELERRVEELERLHHPHYPEPVPYVPYVIPYVPPVRIYPYISPPPYIWWGSNTAPVTITYQSNTSGT